MSLLNNIYQELDQDIKKNFGKDIRFYRSKIREYNVTDEWQAICEIEGYNSNDLFNLIKESIQESQAKYNVEYFIFSQDELRDITDKNVKEYVFFPTLLLSYPEEHLDRFFIDTIIYLKHINKIMMHTFYSFTFYVILLIGGIKDESCDSYVRFFGNNYTGNELCGKRLHCPKRYNEKFSAINGITTSSSVYQCRV